MMSFDMRRARVMYYSSRISLRRVRVILSVGSHTVLQMSTRCVSRILMELSWPTELILHGSIRAYDGQVIDISEPSGAK